MGRCDSPPKASSEENGNSNANNDVGGVNSIRDRFPLKRNNPNPSPKKSSNNIKPLYLLRHRQVGINRFNRKGLASLFRFKGAYLLYMMIFIVLFVFAMSSMVMQSSIGSVFGSERQMTIRRRPRLGSSLRFLQRRVLADDALHFLRSKPRIGLRPPRIALVCISFFLSHRLCFFVISITFSDFGLFVACFVSDHWKLENASLVFNVVYYSQELTGTWV